MKAKLFVGGNFPLSGMETLGKIVMKSFDSL